MFTTLTELRYIVAVANEKHFGKAAAKCFVSQPTLSIAIKKLESNLGITIFERDKNQVIITEIGQEFIARAKQILEAVTDIEDLAKQNNNIYNQPIKIGAIHTVGPYLFPELIKQISTSPIKLLIEEGYTEDLTKKLFSGSLDAIIVAKPFNKPNLEAIDLYSEPLDIIIPKKHPWSNKKSKVTAQDLISETMLLLDKGNCFRDQVLQICPQCIVPSLDNNQPITTSSIETIKYMVANGIGLSIVPRYSLRDSDKHLFSVKTFSKPEPKREIIIAYRKSFSRKALINELATIINHIYR